MGEWKAAFVFLDISDPLVAWLVYRGEIVSAPRIHERALSFWSTRYLEGLRSNEARAARYQTELQLESLRQSECPEAVSRLTGSYLFPDRGTALAAAERWGEPFDRETLAEVGIRPASRTSQHDSEWITHEMRSPDSSWMRRYLAGHVRRPTPIWELVVDGRALVFGTELRTAAYETAKKTWPDSLALLELARLGVELDSDLGLVTAMVLGGPQHARVDYVMNFDEANDPVSLNV